MGRWGKRRQSRGQQGLLGFADRAPVKRSPPAVRSSTSIAAARRVAPDLARREAEVLEIICEAGERGATRKEIAAALSEKLGRRIEQCSVTGRVDSLKDKNLVWEGSERRDGGKVLRLRKLPRE